MGDRDITGYDDRELLELIAKGVNQIGAIVSDRISLPAPRALFLPWQWRVGIDGATGLNVIVGLYRDFVELTFEVNNYRVWYRRLAVDWVE